MHTFHVLGVATTETNKRFSGCPYTTNARYLIDLLIGEGHQVKHYCNVGSETTAENIFVTPKDFLANAFGEDHETQYHADPKPPAWGRVLKDFSIAAAAEIRKHIKPYDFVILPSDGSHDVIGYLEDIPNIRIVESNVGYHDPVAKYRIFHTHTWRSAWRGRVNRANDFYEMFKDKEPFISHNPNVMVPIWEPRLVEDTVIPPMFDPNDFPCETEKEDYFLFLGRIIRNKGIIEAIRLAEEVGTKLVIAGPGDFEREFGMKPPKHVEFIGMANFEVRAERLAKARCLLAFSLYDEPCGYIAPEAFLSGTPAITIDTGGFTETNRDGVSGFKGECYSDWVDAVGKLPTLDPKAIRQYALDHFTPNAVKAKYDRFWQRIHLFELNGFDPYFTNKGA